MNTSCFECRQPAECDHHVVPQSRGGTKTVPLCGVCHGKAHHTGRNMAIGALMRDWHRARRAQGLAPGYRDNLTAEARIAGARKSAQKSTEKARDEMSDIAAVAAQKRSEGRTLQEIADHLNSEKYVTTKGKEFAPVQVKRILDRLPAKAWPVPR